MALWPDALASIIYRGIIAARRNSRKCPPGLDPEGAYDCRSHVRTSRLNAGLLGGSSGNQLAGIDERKRLGVLTALQIDRLVLGGGYVSEQLATRVQIQMGKKRGRVVIEFGSADDLDRIVSEIIGSGPGLAPD